MSTVRAIWDAAKLKQPASESRTAVPPASPLGKNVVYTLPTLGIGGGVNIVLEHATRLALLGHKVSVLNFGPETELNWRDHPGVTVISHAWKDKVDQLFLGGVDVLVCTGWQTVYEVLFRGLPSKSLFYFVQSIESRFYPDGHVDRDMAEATYHFGIPMFTEASWIAEWLQGLTKATVPKVRNGLSQQFLDETRPLQPRTGRRVMIEGPLGSHLKRLDLAFMAVDNLDVEVWLVSSSGDLSPWMKPTRVFRSVPYKDMPSLYASCDLLIKLSDVEGMFGPPLEMMAQGGVCITSDVEGSDEFMIDGVNGVVVPRGDWRAAREAVIRLTSDQTERRQLANAALLKAHEFSWDESIGVLDEMFRTAKPTAHAQALDDPRIRIATRQYMRSASGIDVDVRAKKDEVVSVDLEDEKSSAEWVWQGWIACERGALGYGNLGSCNIADATQPPERWLTVERPDVGANYSGYDSAGVVFSTPRLNPQVSLQMGSSVRPTQSPQSLSLKIPEPVSLGKLVPGGMLTQGSDGSRIVARMESQEAVIAWSILPSLAQLRDQKLRISVHGLATDSKLWPCTRFPALIKVSFEGRSILVPPARVMSTGEDGHLVATFESLEIVRACATDGADVALLIHRRLPSGQLKVSAGVSSA